MAEYIVFVCDACQKENRQELEYSIHDGSVENRSPLVKIVIDGKDHCVCPDCLKKIKKSLGI